MNKLDERTRSSTLYARSRVNRSPISARPCFALPFAMRAASAVSCSRRLGPPVVVENVLTVLRELNNTTSTFVFNIFSDFVCNSRVQAFLVSHFFLDIRPRELKTEEEKTCQIETE